MLTLPSSRAAFLSGTPRAVPSGYNTTLPIKLLNVIGPGQVVTDYNAVDAAINSRASIYNPTACHICPSTGGVDSVAAGNTRFATFDFGMRTWTGGSEVIIDEDITVNPGGLRNTDASQASQLLKVVRPSGHILKFYTPGFDPTTQTYTQDGTNTNCWGTPAGVLTSLAQVKRVLRIDIVDSFGYYRQFKKYTTLALLNAAPSDGFFWDDAAKQLWPNMGANVNTFKSVLKCMFTDTSNNARFLNIGSSVVFDAGVVFEGQQMVTLDGGGRKPQFWVHGAESKWATSKAYAGGSGGDFVATSTRIHSCEQDGINNSTFSAAGESLQLVINSYITNPGEVSVFPVDGTIQCVSAHGGGDSGYWGCIFIGANGQIIADTGLAGHNNVSWIIACLLGPSGIAVDNLVFGSAGTRKFLFDSCISLRSSTVDLRFDVGATGYVYNTPFEVVAGGTTIPYTPSSPP